MACQNTVHCLTRKQENVLFTHELHEVVDSLGNMENFSTAEELNRAYIRQSVQFILNA